MTLNSIISACPQNPRRGSDAKVACLRGFRRTSRPSEAKPFAHNDAAKRLSEAFLQSDTTYENSLEHNAQMLKAVCMESRPLS